MFNKGNGKMVDLRRQAVVVIRHYGMRAARTEHDSGLPGIHKCEKCMH